MSLSSGTQLGNYEIRTLLGAGGMGEVYLARDGRLGRLVALKILPAEVGASQERMRRFVQEAKAAAALNHPNVAHVYEIGEAGGARFIAMEYVEGETLRELMRGGRVPLRSLLEWLAQAADGLAKAHASLALTLAVFDWDTTSAERHYRRAIEINPNYASARHWYGAMLCNLGRFDEGLAESRRALELEPFSPPAITAHGINLYKARRYDEAVRQFERTLELSPDHPHANYLIFAAYAAKGDYARAVPAYVRHKTLVGEPAGELERLRKAFEAGGWQGFLRARIRYIEGVEARGMEVNEVATVYAMAGDRDKAMHWLEKSYAERSDLLTWLLVAPSCDNLREDARFQALVRRVGFAD